MSQTIKINNFGSANILSQTRLSDDIAANVSSLPVINNADFGNNSIVLIGEPGQNNCEILLASASNDATHVMLQAPTKLSHNRNEPVISLFGNQIKIYSASDQYDDGRQPDDSHFSAINGGTVTIDPASKLSTYTDPAGTSNIWYKYSYANGLASTETALTNSKAVRADQNRHYCSLTQIRRAAGFADATYVTDDVIDQYRQAAEAEVISTIGAVYKMPLPQPTNPLIVNTTKDLAAGMLMVDQHQVMNPSLAKEGQAKITNAQATLLELATKALILYDSNFIEEVIDAANGVSSNVTDSIGYTNTPHSDYIDNPVLYDMPAFGVKDKY